MVVRHGELRAGAWGAVWGGVGGGDMRALGALSKAGRDGCVSASDPGPARPGPLEAAEENARGRRAGWGGRLVLDGVERAGAERESGRARESEGGE